jgi:hypothetical protein
MYQACEYRGYSPSEHSQNVDRLPLASTPFVADFKPNGYLLETTRLSSAFFQWVALPLNLGATDGGICIYSKSPFKKLWLCGEEENNLISIIFSLSQPPVDQLSYPIIVLINTTTKIRLCSQGTPPYISYKPDWKPRLPSNTRHSFTKYLEYLEPSQVTTRCVAIYQNKDLETIEL